MLHLRRRVLALLATMLGLLLSIGLQPQPAAADPPQYTITVEPVAQTQIAGKWAYLTTHVRSASRSVDHVRVDIKIVSGPNTGPLASSWTDPSGDTTEEISYAYGSVQQLQMSVTEDNGAVDTAEPITVTWLPAATISLAPQAQTAYLGRPAALTATVTVPDGGTLPSSVDFAIQGANSGQSGSKPLVVDSPTSGHADFGYTSQSLTSDTVTASVFDSACVTDQSAAVTVDWQPPFAATLAPATQSAFTGRTASVTATIAQDGAPYSGGPVEFTVTSGPNASRTGSATTDADGHAVFRYSGSAAGRDSIEASFTDPAGATHRTNTVTVDWADAPITATGQDLAERECRRFTAAVAGFTVPDPQAAATEYAAVVDWGDDTRSSTGTVTGPTGGPFTVSGSHRYMWAGDYTVTVTITAVAHPSDHATATTRVRVG